MRKHYIHYFLLIIMIGFSSCKIHSSSKNHTIPDYIPTNQQLHDEIVALDKEFFDAYNTCDLDKQAAIYADDIEFFHDKGGLMTSKSELLQGTKENVCGKVTRELVDGTIEVYPINNYGAVEIGFHTFHNSEEPDAESIPSKFIVIWHQENGNWRMAKIISLH